ncbi:MAG: ribosome silencing factor [Micrococcaceae bacterium]
MINIDGIKENAKLIANVASDKLANNVVIFDVQGRFPLADYFVIASGDNERQVNAIVDGIREKMLKQKQQSPLRVEGRSEGRWVLLDYADIIVHVQHKEDREFYALDKLWQDCPRLEFEFIE